MGMKVCLFQLTIFITLFVLIGSIQVPVEHLYLENELIFDLSGSSTNEWTIETDPNHIFYITFLIKDDVEEHLLSSFLTINGVNQSNSLLFPSDTKQLSPFYSTGNAVSITFKGFPTLNPIRLKVEKAVSCPFDIGDSSSCGRVVDELSCYCALFSPRTWEDTKAYCQSYNMSFLSIESYDEDLGVFNAFAGLEVLWIGLIDTSQVGEFMWDSTGKPMSPSYMSWAPGYPLSNCDRKNGDCVAYSIRSSLPAWIDLSCNASYSGICELQPSDSSRSSLPVQNLYLENELMIDLSGLSAHEWIITTEANHIFYFTFLFNDDVDVHHFASSSSTIIDVNQPDSLLFPSDNNQLSPFYSTGNAVSIKFKGSTLYPLRLKVEKAVSCPFNIGGSSSCGRVVDELSCYCALFSPRTWENTKAYCKSYNMSFLSVESYEEDLGVFNAFVGLEVLWIGLSDTSSETTFVWDSTGKNLSPGYMSWAPDHPLSNSCGGNTSDCVAYNIASALPAWVDLPCTNVYGGICELQPTSTQPVKLNLEKELIFDLSGSSNEWIITTDPNHIFYFSFITPYSIDEQQKQELKSSLTILDVDRPDTLLYPFKIDALSPFYSTDNAVSIRFIKPFSTKLNGLRIRAEKAVPCPFNLGPSSSCGRVVDELSCYCGTFVGRNWTATKDFCKANNMKFVSIESYEEDLALYTAFGGNEYIWIGASDSVSEGAWIWDSTGKPMSPGYQGWLPGIPESTCAGGSNYDCALYIYGSSSLPMWNDNNCSINLGGICELQPSNSSTL